MQQRFKAVHCQNSQPYSKNGLFFEAGTAVRGFFDGEAHISMVPRCHECIAEWLPDAQRAYFSHRSSSTSREMVESAGQAARSWR
jgi:hypothetical protein